MSPLTKLARLPKDARGTENPPGCASARGVGDVVPSAYRKSQHCCNDVMFNAM
jgi:hypothetical protein